MTPEDKRHLLRDARVLNPFIPLVWGESRPEPTGEWPRTQKPIHIPATSEVPRVAPACDPSGADAWIDSGTALIAIDA